MIIGQGIDLVSINRIGKVLGRYKQQFVERILSDREIEKFNILNSSKGLIYLATRFAGKEAFAKAIGTGIGFVAFKEISIENDKLGKPVVEISQEVKLRIASLLKSNEELLFHVSLTNTCDLAFASVIIENHKH